VRVLAVAQRLREAHLHVERSGNAFATPSGERAVSQLEIMPSYSAVWLNALAARRKRSSKSSLPFEAAIFAASGALIGGIGHHRNELVVLGRRAHHRGAADVDVLDGVVMVTPGFAMVCAKG
jgi:hypothetical protein